MEYAIADKVKYQMICRLSRTALDSRVQDMKVEELVDIIIQAVEVGVNEGLKAYQKDFNRAGHR